MLASEIAGARGFPGLQDIIERFSRKRSLLHGERDVGGQQRQEGGQVRYSDLDTILLGMGLPEHIPRFAAHNVSLDIFLTLNKADLENMGIQKVRRIDSHWLKFIILILRFARLAMCRRS
jgi:hypothetical protein